MRINFLGLQAFLSIAERGTFQRAAADLNLSPTALSHRVKKLEDELGVKLLSRTTREVTLTRAGLELLPRARQAIEELEAATESLRKQGRSLKERLAIGCLPTIANHYLPRILRGFGRRYPDVIVRVYDNSASEIRELVQSGEAEFGVTIVAASSWDLEIETLLKEPFFLVCPRRHPLAAEEFVSWERLEGQPLVRVSPQTGNRVLIDDALGARRESLKWLYEVQHTGTATKLVAAGVGLTILPRLAIDVDAEPELAMVPLRNPSVTRTLGIVSKRGAPLSPVAEELRLMIVAELNKIRDAGAAKGRGKPSRASAP